MSKKVIKRIPAPAQDVLTILDVILQVINVVQAIYNLVTNIFGE